MSAHDRLAETLSAVETLITEHVAVVAERDRLAEENATLRRDLRATRARLNSIISGDDEGDAGELFNDSCS